MWKSRLVVSVSVNALQTDSLNLTHAQTIDRGELSRKKSESLGCQKLNFTITLINKSQSDVRE